MCERDGAIVEAVIEEEDHEVLDEDDSETMETEIEKEIAKEISLLYGCAGKITSVSFTPDMKK